MYSDRTTPTPAEHPSDEDLISLLYSDDDGDAHLRSCPTCQSRRNALLLHRSRIEREQLPTADLSAAHLAAQRRDIYARLSERHRFWSVMFDRRWVSAAATVMVLAGSLFFYERDQARPQEDKISDVELAQEVSRLSQSAEPSAAQPLKGLFE